MDNKKVIELTLEGYSPKAQKRIADLEAQLAESRREVEREIESRDGRREGWKTANDRIAELEKVINNFRMFRLWDNETDELYNNYDEAMKGRKDNTDVE